MDLDSPFAATQPPYTRRGNRHTQAQAGLSVVASQTHIPFRALTMPPSLAEILNTFKFALHKKV